MFVWSGKVTADLLQIGAQRANLALVALSSSLGVAVCCRIVASLAWRPQHDPRFRSHRGGGRFPGLRRFGLVSMLAGFVLLGLGMSAIFPTALGLAGDRFRETGTVFGRS